MRTEPITPADDDILPPSREVACDPDCGRRLHIRVWVDPIALPPVDLVLPWGATIAEIVATIPLLPEHEARRALFEVTISGHPIPRAIWHRVRPAAWAEHRPVTLQIRLPIRGGKGGGWRKVLSIIAAVVLLAAAAFVAAGGLAPYFAVGAMGPQAVLTAGSLGAKLLSGALTLAASWALQGLAPKPDTEKDRHSVLDYASATNAFEPGATLQRAIGRVKVVPQMVMPPFTSIDNGVKRADGTTRYSQYVTGVYALAGRHLIENLQTGGVSIDTLSDIETEILDGSDPTVKLTLVTDTRVEDQLNISLSKWETDPDDDDEDDIAIVGTIAEAEPLWHRMETRDGVSEFRIEYVAPSGLIYNDPDGQRLRTTVSLRHRMRRWDPDTETWGDWLQLPELYISGKSPSTALRMHLVIHWVKSVPAIAGSAWPPVAKAFNKIQGWTALASHAAWSSPLAAPADDGYALWHYEDQRRIHLYLRRGTYPKGRWQIEVKRSQAMRWVDFTWTPPARPPHMNDFFYPYAMGGLGLPDNPGMFQDDIAVTTVQNVWPEYPFATTDGEEIAYIAIRARNRQLGPLTCIATGRCASWNGATWVPDQPTSNPADWYRHVLADSTHNAEPTSLPRIDLARLQAWAAWCSANNYRVGAIGSGQSVEEVLSLIAQAGFASPIRGAVESVVIDGPVTTGPVGLISLRNAGRFGVQKAFKRRPHALRVTFADADDDYRAREIIVYDDGQDATTATRIEAVTYESIVHESHVIERAKRDFAWLKHRMAFHTFSQDFEALEWGKGDLVLMETDILGGVGGRGRIQRVVTRASDGKIIGFELDDAVQYGEAVSDLWGIDDLTVIDDLWATALPPGVVLRLADGTIATYRTTTTIPASMTAFAQRAIVLKTPIAMPTAGGDALIGYDTLAVTGPLASITREVLIWEIEPGPDLSAQITAIDYAASQIYGDT